MNDYDKMQFVKDTAKADRFFFHYLLGYMSNHHMDDMVECAKSYREDHDIEVGDENSEDTK